MAGETIDLEYIISPDSMAVQIADQWREWTTKRSEK